MTKIIIGGDICPTLRDAEAFNNGNAEVLFGDVKTTLQKADFAIANLETPLIAKKTPIQKSGAVFGSSPKMLEAVKNSGITFLNMANNHILDHGETGLESTINALKAYDLESGGAGKNLAEAAQPFKKQVKDKNIAILSYAEHEFSIAESNKGGANPLDTIDFINKIKNLRASSDLVILLYHGGKEHYQLPSPKQQRLCRFFIEQGVDYVVCQHSHTGGAYEEHKGGHIFYGQGNFLFDAHPLKKDWLYKGFLIEVDIASDGSLSHKLIPYVHKSWFKDEIGIRKMTQSEASDYLGAIETQNEKMRSNPNYVKEQWEEMSMSLKNTYLSILNGNGRIARKLNEKLPWLNYVYSNQRKLVVKNIINCETHREIVETILKHK